MDVISSTDSYLSLLLSLPGLPPVTVLAIVLLMLSRIIPIMTLAPFFGSKNLPGPLKIMFSLALIAIMLPQLLLGKHYDLTFSWGLGIYVIKEVFIGAILGFMVSIPFSIVQSSGSLIDHMRGSSSLQVTDPTTQIQTGPIGVVYNMVLIAIYYIIGGPFIFIDAVSRSFELIPIDKLINPAFFNMSMPFWATIIGLMTKVLSLAIQLAAPSLVGVLMAEMFLGIANRMAPQVQIVFLGIPLKSWVGLALLTVAWGFILQQMSKESLIWTRGIEEMLYQILPSKA